MKQRFDFSFHDIMNGTFFKHYSENTIKKAINRLEAEYFPRKNLLRNSTRQSDIVFRYEIKDLLLLLLKLELESPFADKRSSKLGVSTLNLEVILQHYEEISSGASLREYEESVLSQTFNAKSSLQFTRRMMNFQKSLSALAVLIAEHYDQLPDDCLESIIQHIDMLSKRVIQYSSKFDSITSVAQYAQQIPMININHGETEGSVRQCPLSMNLKIQIVQAITVIADTIYNFDDHGMCTRKTGIDGESDHFNSSYFELYSYHTNFASPDNPVQTEKDADDIVYDGQGPQDIEELRQKTEELLNEHWGDQAVPSLHSRNSNDKPIEKFISEKITTLEQHIKVYIENYLRLLAFLDGTDNTVGISHGESAIKLFSQYENQKEMLHQISILGISLSPVLKTIEQQACLLVVDHPKDYGQRITPMIDHEMMAYQKKIKDVHEALMTEFSKIETGDFPGGFLNESASNISSIKESNSEIIKNILAVILGIEEHKWKFKTENDE